MLETRLDGAGLPAFWAGTLVCTGLWQVLVPAEDLTCQAEATKGIQFSQCEGHLRS